MPRLKKTLLIPSVLILLFFTLSACGGQAGKNIAIGKKYTFNWKPNYSLTKDKADKIQLTDGKYADAVGKSIWVQKASVGWYSMKFKPLEITIDLQQVESIDSVVFSTGARQYSGIWWPMVISVCVSENNRDFYEVGNLVRLSRNPLPDTAGLRKHRFKANGLNTKGRWVKLIIQASLLVVCDEIEIYRGAESNLTKPLAGKPITIANLKNTNYLTQEGCARRFNLDLAAVSRQLDNSRIGKTVRGKLRKTCENLQDEIIETRFPESAQSFLATLPYNNLHERILALNAIALRAKGFRGLTVWKNDRYAPLDWYDTPIKRSGVKASIVTMLNEHRADVINLTNATDKSMNVTFSINDLPGGTNPSYIVPHQVEFVDTREGVVYATALVELQPKDGKFTTTVPAGMTRQIWLASNVKDVKPADYFGKIKLSSNSVNKTVPLQLSVYPSTMPDQLDIEAGIWDYASGKSYMVTPKNLQPALDDLKAHYINLPWGSTWTVMYPHPKQFDDKGNLIKQLDFTEYDKWIKNWPDAKRYMVLLGVHPKRKMAERFARGTKEFDNALTQWAAAWQKHNRELGLKPGQVGVNIIDEVHMHDQLVASLQWSKVFKAAAPDIAIFNDPLIPNISKKDWPLLKELLTYTDIVCPQPTQYYRASKERQKVFEKFAAGKNKAWWFYMCSGPVRRFNPAYYRLQPQYGFAVGATGSSFWAYADGRCQSSWNEYPDVATVGFTPLYLTKYDVTTGKHWEAFREGLQDTQYMIMLDSQQKDSRHAKNLAQRLIPFYKKTADSGFDWMNANACIKADYNRIEILKLLKK